MLLPYGYQNDHKIQTKVKNNEIIFGFIGRLDIHTKELDVLLKAFSKFIYFVPSAQLWIVGDSDEKFKFETMIQSLNLKKNVSLFGNKFGQEKNSLLQEMDIFVHLSRNEGLPNSVIEAASFGKPCLVTDATNIAENIQKYSAGRTIYKLSSTELFIALNSLYLTWTNDLKYNEMCKNAVTMVNETYNWNKILTDLNEKLYKIK